MINTAVIKGLQAVGEIKIPAKSRRSQPTGGETVDIPEHGL